MGSIQREIRLESDRDPGFADEIRSMPGCEHLDRCIQCATCSGVCPLSVYMDHTPRRIMELTRDGFKDDVLRSNTIWLCASCYECQAECPMEVGVTDVMVALKNKAIASGVAPKDVPTPVLAREFFRMVRETGRVSEGKLVQRLYLKTGPAKFFGMIGLGRDLMRTGRFSLRSERMKRPEDLQRVLDGTPGVGK